MANLSVCLICCNEANKLPSWLAAVKPIADEIIAVDSGSKDETVSLLKSAGVRVEWRAWSGYADQRNYAAYLAKSDWILFLDADEWPDSELRQSLFALKKGFYPQEKAYELSYKVFFLGKLLRYGGFLGERHLRLYRRGTACWENRKVHECLKTKGIIGLLPGYVEHYSYTSIQDCLIKMERYSIEAAHQMYIAGKTVTKQKAWVHSIWAFLKRYILRLGFLDGWEGYLIARLEALYTLNKYLHALKYF